MKLFVTNDISLEKGLQTLLDPFFNIFNTTNEVTLKKFRWQINTARNLFQISNRYAELYGAKVLEPRLRNSHTEYAAW